MKRAQEALGELVNYDAVTAIFPLEPPTIEKKDVPTVILCSRFEKAHARTERTMDRSNRKVEQLEERIQRAKSEIISLESNLHHWSGEVGKGVGWLSRATTDRSDAGAVERYNRDVARHNDAIDQVRRYEERISDATDKHNDLVERHNEAVEEAREQLEQLTAEALAEIDNDIVAVLDRCTDIATRLCESDQPDDCMAALEVCFIALKIHHAFAEDIDTTTAREEARNKIDAIGKLFFELSQSSVSHNALVTLFRGNADLIAKNTDLSPQIVHVTGGADQRVLGSMTQSLQEVFGEKFGSNFKYMGVVDPTELDVVVVRMNESIASVNANIAKAKMLFDSTQETARAALVAHQSAETLLLQMKANVEDIGDELFHRGHFACQMVSKRMIDELYGRELRPAAATIRGYLMAEIGEEQLDALAMEHEDRYAIKGAETTIQDANLLALQTQREQVDVHVNLLSGVVQKLKRQISEAERVPLYNSDAFRSSISNLYLLSCVPILGFIAALVISNKIKTFATAFSSTNQTYQELATEIVTKNRTVQIINMALIVNFVAAVILMQTGKRLRSYMAMQTSARSTPPT